MAVTHKILTKDGIQEKNLTPLKAIRQKCLECSNWNYAEVTRCHITDCALYPYRFGKVPNHANNGKTPVGNPALFRKKVVTHTQV